MTFSHHPDKKDKKKKLNGTDFVYEGISPSDFPTTSAVCEGDVCSLTPAVEPTSSDNFPAFKIQPMSDPSTNPFSDTEEESKKVNTLEIPLDLWEAMKETAKKGCLYSFLCTLTEEYVTEKLKANHYSERQINITNQILKTLIMMCAMQSFKAATQSFGQMDVNLSLILAILQTDYYYRYL